MINLRGLSNSQRKAATTNSKRVIVLAGAGAGKTKTMVAYVHYRLYNRVCGRNIFCITFTRFAAAEMRKRINALGLSSSSKVFINTFHKLGMYILETYGNIRFKSIISDDEKNEILTRISEKFKVKLSVLTDKIRNYNLCDCDRVTGIAIREYIMTLKRYSLMDIDLILPLTIKLLKDSEIADKVRKEIKYLLVDEYQDSNDIQNMLIEQINPEYLLVFGDDSQSIYSWNGGKIDYILDFRKKYNAEMIKLETNYRSTSQIVESSNNLIKNNKKQIFKDIRALRSGNDINIAFVEDENIQAIRIITDISKHFYEEGNIGILCRTNKEIDFVSSILNKYDIKFASSKKDNDCQYTLNIINTISNLDNDILVGKQFKVSGEIRSKTVEDNISLFKAIRQYEPSKISDVYLELNKEISVCEALDALKIVEQKLDFIDIKLEEKIYKWQQKNKSIGITENSIRDYLQYKNTEESQEILRSNDNKICLTTIHASKGLEYSHVIIPYVSSVDFPKGNEDVEESRRLFYVAITRAKNSLSIFVPEHIYDRGTIKEINPSIFINEL